MKKIITICAAILMTVSVFAQAPNKMSYQAVVRDGSNNLVSSAAVGMKISILQSSASGTAVYVETQTPTSNANGLVSIEIGAGTVVSGTFAAIDWANGPYFIKTETDPTGGTNYTIIGTSQLLSVPYALHAKTADNGFSGDYNDLTNQPTIPSVPTNVSAFTNDAGYLTSFTEVDGSITNEIQTISRVGTTVTLSNGGGSFTDSVNAPGFNHYIGEKFGGGVVFYVWKDSAGIEHGLIVAATELPPQVWSNVDFFNTNGTAWSSWDGLSNSNGIVAQPGHTNSAAKACLDLISGGQSDWYLPALDEIMLLFTHRFNINKSLMTIQGANQLGVSVQYWTSTEVSFGSTTAYIFLAGNFSSGFSSKDVAINYVRAIRAF
jgi:hypothetical protein